MLSIEIPDSIEIAMQLPETKKAEEVRRLLAIKLYEKGILGIGKASELANNSRIEFMALLKSEGISLNYDEEEYQEDLKTLRRIAK